MPKPRQPTREEVIDLAIRLGRREYVSAEWIRYPDWAGPPEDWPMLNIAAKLREWAAAILKKQVKPPEWLVREDAARLAAAAPPPTPDTARADKTETARRLRELPLAGAFLLRTLFRRHDPSSHPPPYPRRLPPFRQATGPQWTAAPPLRVWRCPTPVSLFDNAIVVSNRGNAVCRTDAHREEPVPNGVETRVSRC